MPAPPSLISDEISDDPRTAGFSTRDAAAVAVPQEIPVRDLTPAIKPFHNLPLLRYTPEHLLFSNLYQEGLCL
jgi:hypothetical protein